MDIFWLRLYAGLIIYAAIAHLIGLVRRKYQKLKRQWLRPDAGSFKTIPVHKREQAHDADQAELDAYKSRAMNLSEIGRHYERQIGYLFENEGYDVRYEGAVKGLADGGIDLIVRKNGETFVIQAKCWKDTKEIPAEVVHKIAKSAAWFSKSRKLKKSATAIIYSKTEFSDEARVAAAKLGVELYIIDLDKNYPMIKCNINQDGERIFHLPMDEYYDKIKIRLHEGNLYVATTAEAKARGFRRTYKRNPNRAS